MDDEFKGKRLLTVHETARFLGISAQAIYNGVSRKSKKAFPVTPIRIGGRIRFDVQDLETYIESKKEKK
jgi:predicted DNA-binding transcriptional regulator AlpA